MARVTLQNVAKSFGGDRGPWAVQDFSLDIADGELVVFVGPSGCGKSTTLRMLAGLALQLLSLRTSESMGNHDSEIVDAGSVD